MNHLHFATKRVQFQGSSRRIICQNENGPCPLLAICNSLILRGDLEWPAGNPDVDSKRLQELLVGYLVDKHSHRSGDLEIQYMINDTMGLIMQSRFLEGIDVNLKFGSPTAFEYTSELAVFDLAGVPLVHGWIVDAQDHRYPLLGTLSYNDITAAVVSFVSDDRTGFVSDLRASMSRSLRETLSRRFSSKHLEPIVFDQAPSEAAGASTTTAQVPEASNTTAQPRSGQDASDVEQLLSEMLTNLDTGPRDAPEAAPAQDASIRGSTASRPDNTAAEAGCSTQAGTSSDCPFNEGDLRTMAHFLRESQSQLTISGIFRLSESLRPGQLAVFFRNNHFNTLYKHPTDGALYILVTDQGYQNEEGVAWEKLDNERGDTTYVTADFEPYERYRKKQEEEQSEILRQIQQAEQREARQATSEVTSVGSSSHGRHNVAGSGATLWRPSLPATPFKDAPDATACTPEELQSQSDRDFALALQLQEEEERRMAAAEESRRQATADRTPVVTQNPVTQHAQAPGHGSTGRTHQNARGSSSASYGRAGRQGAGEQMGQTNVRVPSWKAGSSSSSWKKDNCVVM